jgi:hypothetical protein
MTINNLQNLVENIDSFDQKFNQTMNTTETSEENDMVKQLLADSKYFFVDKQKFNYDDKDQIFNREGPIEKKVVY